MATVGLPQTPSENYSLQCSLCIEVYRSPKLLPCYHTFCEACLQELIKKHPSGRFRCPICRRKTTVPPGGVAAFQTNFYIDAEELKQAVQRKRCASHPKLELDCYCVACEQVLCAKCILTRHRTHTTEDLAETTARAFAQLTNYRFQIEKRLSEIQHQLMIVNNEQNEIKEQSKIVEENICSRQADLKAVIDSYAQDNKINLKSFTRSMLTRNIAIRTCLERPYAATVELLFKVALALKNREPIEMIELAQEIEYKTYILPTMPRTLPTVERLTFRPQFHPDDTMKNMLFLFGVVTYSSMLIQEPEVALGENFRCPEDLFNEVFALYPSDEQNSVWVAYKPHVLREYVAREFDTKGVAARSIKADSLEKVLWLWNKDVNPTPELASAFENNLIFAKKAFSDRAIFLEQDSNTSRPTHVKFKEFNSSLNGKLVFNVNCARALAMDASINGDLFAVLEQGPILSRDQKAEEPTIPSMVFLLLFLAAVALAAFLPSYGFTCLQLVLYLLSGLKPLIPLKDASPPEKKNVRLYRRPQSNSVATYVPPCERFRPTDVCFYNLSGREVLLVADEYDDAIHVVNVQDGRLTFARYLAAGCPQLAQPKALNTDTRGRLWVACSVGRILVFEPVLKPLTAEKQ